MLLKQHFQQHMPHFLLKLMRLHRIFKNNQRLHKTKKETTFILYLYLTTLIVSLAKFVAKCFAAFSELS